MTNESARALLVELEASNSQNETGAALPSRNSAVTQQFSELVAEVVRWRTGSGHGHGGAEAAKATSAGTDSAEGEALSALRKMLNDERQELDKEKASQAMSEHLRVMAKLSVAVDAAPPDFAASGVPTDGLQDFSGKHWLLTVTDQTRTGIKVSDIITKDAYGSPAQLDKSGDCNQNFGPGLVETWRKAAREWCVAPPKGQLNDLMGSYRSEMQATKLALDTSITCWQYQQHQHSGPDQLCVVHGGALNLGICMCVRMYYVCLCVCMSVCMYVCMYISIDTHTHTHIYIYAHTHTHTYTWISSPSSWHAAARAHMRTRAD